MHKIVLLIAAVTLSIFGFMFYQYQQQKKELLQFELYQQVFDQKSAQIYQQATDWSKPIVIDTHDSRLSAEYQTMLDFVLKIMQQKIELRNQYLRELKQADWDQFLNIQRLEQDKQQNYVQTEKMLQQVDAAMQQYQQNVQQQQASIKNKIKALAIKARFRRYLTEVLVDHQAVNQNQTLFELEKLRFQEAQQLFQLLKQHDWVNQKQMFRFSDEKIVAQFNTLYQHIVELDQQMHQVSTQHQKSVRSSLINETIR